METGSSFSFFFCHMLQVKEIEPEICPICSRAFRRSDIEAHVNECLDSKPSAKEPPLPKAPEYRSPDKPLNLDRLLNNIHAPKMPAVSKQPSPVPSSPAPAPVKPMEASIIDLTTFESPPAPAPAPTANPMLSSHFLDELTGHVKPEEVKVKLPDFDDLLKPTPLAAPSSSSTSTPPTTSSPAGMKSPERHKILLSNDDDDTDVKVARTDVTPTSTATPTSSTSRPPMGDDEIQAAALALFKRKKEQEEQDRLMALRLADELAAADRAREEERQKHLALQLLQQEEEKRRRQREEEDQLKMVLQEEEEQRRRADLRRKAEEDERLAKQIFNDEKREADAKKEQREWEETLKYIKDQAKVEMDAALAKLLKEKEDLEASLNEMRMNHNEVGEMTISVANVEYPDYWQKQVANFQSFEVPPHTAEYDRVIGEFRKTAHVRHVRSLIRNQNRSLWMWFYLKKKEITAKNHGNDNEKYLFHGSRSNAYETILAEGFDHRVANMGGAIGAGVYFATQASTSMGYIGAPGGNRKMLCCRVLLGEVGAGQAGLRRPPPKGRGKGLCDSVGSPGMYVIFDNYQAYPEYTIIFSA